MSFVTNNDEFGFATKFTSVNLTPGPYPSWKLTATPDKSSYTKVGEAIAYSYTLTNTGNVTINTFTVNGNKTGTISCLAPSLAAGASTTCSSTYTTVAGDLGNPIAYDATATGTPAAGTLAPSSVNGTITFSPQPALAVVPTPNPTSFTAAGQAIAYSFKVTNTGNVTINSVAMTGTKTGTITCAPNTLAPGAETTCTSSYTTVAGDVGNPIAYDATASGTPTAGTLTPVAVNGSITFTAQPALAVVPTPNPTSFTAAGQAIAYSFKVTNTGNVTINSVAMTGTKTGAITCAPNTLAPGADTTCTSSYTTVAGDVGNPIAYDATASGTPTAGTLTPVAVNGSITFTAQPTLTVVPTPNPTSFTAAGQAIAYSFKVTNTGNVTINSVAMTGTKTGTITCAPNTLAPGAETTCTSSYTTVAGDVGNPIAYDATATGTPTAGTLTPVAVNGSITFTAQPALAVVPTPNPTSFTAAGQAIAYSFKVTNTGNVTINSVAMTGTKTGAITCAPNTLAPGADTTCTSSYTTVAGDVGNPIAYDATASGTPTAGTLTPVAVNGSITFTAQPTLTVVPTPNPTSFTAAGQAIAYSFKLTNIGNVTINSIAMTGTKTGTITCTLKSLAPGADTTCNSTYTTVAGDVGNPIAYSATATGAPTAGTLTPVAVNGSITFTAQPILTVAATPNPTSFSTAGQVIAYSFKVTNTGNVTINSVAMTGTKTGVITCTPSTLAPGADTTCTSSYTTVAGDVGNPIAYSATASGTPTAGTLTPVAVNGSITFTALPALAVVPTPNPTSFSNAGQAIAYSFKVTNTGNVTINSIAMTGTKTGAITCTPSTLAPGADTTCTSSYTTVAGDVGNPIAYSATANGTPTGGTLAPAVASGSITFTALPALTLAATPNPTSFSNAGQAIAYSFKLTNTGNVTINSLTVTGTKIGTASCVASSLAAGASTTCTSSYTTVAGDVGGPIAYSATANGTPAGGTLAPAVASGSITFTALPALAIATTPNPTTFSKAGQAIAYSYKVTNTGNVTVSSLAVSDTKVTGISCAVTTLSLGASTTCTGSYTTTAADVLAASISSAATANGMFGTTAVSSAAVSTTIQIDANAVRQATQSAIRNFMNRRAEILTTIQPDETRKHQQLPGWLFGSNTEEQDPEPESANSNKSARGRTGTPDIEDRMARRPTRGQTAAGDIATDRTSARTGLNPFGFSGSTDDEGGGRFAFATSLSKLRQTADETRAARDRGPDAPMGLGATSRSTTDRRTEPSRFDVWAEGAMAYYSDNSIGTSQQGHAALLYMGVDYRIHPAILLGALVQLDWVSESTSGLGTSASGQGWMVGPYVSVRLTRNLFFDARAAWGQSDNRVDPLGVYTDKFSTERSLVSAKLTGNWVYGNLRFRPSAEVVYFHETQEAYTNQINVHIPEQSISLGRVSVGPEIGYRFQQDNGAVFEPFVGVKGVWDFDKTADTTVAGIVVGHDPFHVMVEVGATYATPSGISLRGSFAYDGIGDNDLRAYYGRGSITVPFN